MAVLPVGSDFTIGDYIYRVVFIEASSSYYRVAPRVVDKTKTSYADIPSTVSYDGITYTVDRAYWGEKDADDDTIGTFYGCTEMTAAPSIPSTLTSMHGMFNGCTSLRTPPILPSTADGFMACFKNCKSLEEPPIFPPNSNPSMNACFRGCTSLKTAPVLPQRLTGKLYWVFDGCTSLKVPPQIPNGVKELKYAFAGSYITTPPVIPNSVTNMRYCFKDCKGLTTPPTIPSSVTDMGWCFYGCSALVNPPVLPDALFYMEYIFRDCTSLTTAPEIPSNIGNMYGAFRGCSSLKEPPVIPNHVLNIASLFYGCTSLKTTPSIPSNVANMNSCFYDCTSLTSTPTIPSSVTDIAWCFRGCTSLTVAPTISHLNITSVQGLLCRCDKIATAPTLPSTVTDVRSFLLGTAITTPPTLPSGVTNMSFCFSDCTSLLTAPEIPSGVTDITNCFNQCTSLKGFIVVNGSPSENENAFKGTVNPIFILDNYTGGSNYWIEVASAYSNVHYRFNDVPTPNASLTAYRVENNGDENQYKTGEYIFVKLTTKYYTDNSPESTTVSLQTPTLLFDGQSSSATWTTSSEDGQQVNKAWIPTTDFLQHSFSASQSIHYESSSMLSADKSVVSAPVIIEKLYALINAFHDEETGTEGIAFGTLSSQTNSMLVALDAYFAMEMYLRGHRVPIIYESASEPTSADGEDGDIWIQYTV